MLTERYIDLFTKKPLEAMRSGDDFVFDDTGDSLIDKWEKEYAEGHEVDLMEGFSEEDKAKVIRASMAHYHRDKTGTGIAADSIGDTVKRVERQARKQEEERTERRKTFGEY